MLNQLEKVQYKEWADSGQAFSEDLWAANSKHLIRMGKSASYFSIVLAISLIWTKHAKDKDIFIERASLFFEDKDKLDDKFFDVQSHRFGPEGLKTSVIGLKEFKKEIDKIIPDFRQCNPKELKLFQEKALRKLELLKNKGLAKGVGPWLFLGPYKIILGIEKRLWNDSTIDTIVLPSGIEVIRGIRKAIKSGCSLFKDFKKEYLFNEEGTLLDGYAIDNIIQTYFLKVAEATQSKAIHINSAFYLYGGNY